MQTAADALTAAQALARDLLGANDDRWRHTVGVAECAAALAVTVPVEDAETLVVAAWLHDIGYSPTLSDTGLHPLDGAAYLERHGWPARICGLVAHHSGTRFLAAAAADTDDWARALARYPDERSVVSEALTYADQRVGTFGQRMSVQARLDDKAARHGEDSVQGRARAQRDPYLLGVAERVEKRLEEAGGLA
ncbi:HD domain-containing protein [Cryptosporangium phraense]|uniref:HD domain-containing protein n=1 Tax=Cryptosporangium phraense TaxID=2593070 RepID=A0A545AHD9_9ACTN|nr:HD domain-containing protein [Cryptosporangium phraense]TQS40680.1 HD domain-containing protein [Cryptosporangium phraense]